MKNLSHAVTELEHPTRALRVKFCLDRSSELRVQVKVFDDHIVTRCVVREPEIKISASAMNQNPGELVSRSALPEERREDPFVVAIDPVVSHHRVTLTPTGDSEKRAGRTGRVVLATRDGVG